MRSSVLPFAFCLVAVSACSFLLDTDELKGGSPDASTGTGVGGSIGAGGGLSSDASVDTGVSGSICTSDFDCQGLAFDGCKVVKCVKGACVAPEKYSGLAVNPEGAAATVFTADDIGYPTLIADGANFYLGAWRKDGTTSNIDLRRFNENVALGGGVTDLASLTSNGYEQFGSSPGITVVGLLGGRLRLLFAGDPVGMPPMGMHVIDIDESTFKLAPPAQQPMVDPGVTGFDAKPRGPAPRLLSGDWGLWVQSDKLFFFDGKVAATPVYTAKKVVGFAPMIGLGGPYAALETAPMNGPGNQATAIWANGNMSSLAALVGDDTGERRGVAVAPYPEAIANVIVWSYIGANGTKLKTNIAGCIGTACQSAGAIENSDDIPASFPDLASGKVAGKDRDRNFAEIFQITFAQPDDPAKATTVLIGSVIRVAADPDGGADGGTVTPPINPPNFTVATSEGPTSVAAGEIIGPSSVAITNNGKMMVAWVERVGGTQTHALKTRRFAVGQCP